MKPSVNISFLFGEVPLLERFDMAREAGFSGVEIGFPYALPLSDIMAAKQNSDLKIVVINAPAGDLMEGGEGLAPVRLAWLASISCSSTRAGRRRSDSSISCERTAPIA